MPPEVLVSLSDTVEHDEVLALYVANRWSSAEKPELLMRALQVWEIKEWQRLQILIHNNGIQQSMLLH